MALALNLDWASLPMYLLDSILDCLVPMEDYFRFSEVCIEWQRAVCEKLQHLRSNHKRHCLLHQQVPLLMAPAIDNTRDRCCLYDVMQGKSLYEFELRLWRQRCEGSSHGWLILVDDDSYKVTLLNPLSGKRIHLPPLEKSIFIALPGGVRGHVVPAKRRRGVLSNDPDANKGEFVLMMTYSFGGRIAFIKSGEEAWTYIEELKDVVDIVYSNGLFYALDDQGLLFSYDVSNDIKVRRIITSFWNEDAYEGSYLVESPEGDLLRVIKRGWTFVIYKLVWFSRNPRWEEARSLGDVALFLGDSHSTSITTCDFAGCQPNSIYLCTSPNSAFHGRIYIFSLNDRRTVTPLLYPRSQQPLVWISPKFV